MHRLGWNDVYQKLRELPWREKRKVPKHLVPHPSTVKGFMRSSGLYNGQLEDWRYPLEGGAGLHVHVFHDRYEVHLDEVDPSVNLIEHLRQDAPVVYALLSAGVGALLGSQLSNDPNAPLVGGVIAGMLAASSANQTKRDNARRHRPAFL